MPVLVTSSSATLRRQLVLPIGLGSVVMLVTVVLLGTLFLRRAGSLITEDSIEALQDQVKQSLTGVATAQELAQKLHHVQGTVQLVTEIVKDRIVGYNSENDSDDAPSSWINDSFVPFRDMTSQTNKYPLQASLPLWLFQNDSTGQQSSLVVSTPTSVEEWREHLQERPRSYYSNVNVSTATTTFVTRFQDTSRTEDNVHTRAIYTKSAEIGALLKPLWELHPEMVSMTVHFKNQGHGARVQFPAMMPLVNNSSYTSIGCEWMRATNPFTQRPLATEEQIANCRGAGQKVSIQDYNALERPYCRKFVLQAHGDMAWYGPYKSMHNPGLSVLATGSAVFDRLTGEFIACTVMETPQAEMVQSLTTLVVMPGGSNSKKSSSNNSTFETHTINRRHLALVDYETGHTMASTMQSHSEGAHLEGGKIIYHSDFMDEEAFFQLRHAWNLGNRTEIWADEVMQEKMPDTIVERGGRMYTAHPLPLMPKEYDPNYKPQYLILQSISESVYRDVSTLDESIQQDIRRLTILAATIGLIGIAVSLLIVWKLSGTITRPLNWMNRATNKIIHPPPSDRSSQQEPQDDNSSSDQEEGLLHFTNVKTYWGPKTELTDLVNEFRYMIHGFSGTGASTPVFPVDTEVENRVTWISAFNKYYQKAKTRKQLGADESQATSTTEEEPNSYATAAKASVENSSSPSAFVLQSKTNLGRNVRSLGSVGKVHKSNGNMIAAKSRLFYWILLLLVMPLVLVNIVICTLVVVQATLAVPNWINKVEEQSIQLERMALEGSALRKAGMVQARLASPIRDLHLYTRVASWLLFGGMRKSDTFTEVVEGTEDCKGYPTDESCPYFKSDVAVCDCKWQDLYADSFDYCTDYGDISTRALPKRFFFAQARDADPRTGDRPEALSFPAFDNSANTTLWFDDVEELPGVASGSNSSGFETTYDRIRSVSPMGVVGFPIYFYAAAAGLPKYDLGTFVAFDADGSVSGFFGCDFYYASFAHFASDDDSKAYDVAPELCPKGKYGYDPRCRSWYGEGKNAYMKENTPFYITPLYEFPVTQATAASATMAIVNPTTGAYVGQTLLDISLKGIEDMIHGSEGKGNAFMITPGDDVAGSNTAVKPDGTEDLVSDSISDLLLPFDAVESQHRESFDDGVLISLKSGSVGISSFERSTKEGRTVKLTLAYAPVSQRVLIANNPSVYSRGVTVSGSYQYTVGVFIEDESMIEPFREIEEEFDTTLRQMRLVYILTIIGISVVFCGYMFLVSIQVTTPMIMLLRAVQQINQGRLGDDLPPLQGGSTEIRQVYSAFAKLYKVVQISNTAFFSGNMTLAYHFMTGGLDLFRRAGDQKAIGIVSNNIGNMYFASKSHPNFVASGSSFNFEGTNALKCFDEAVTIAQESFDNANGDDKANFAQQLADRLFNRGIFSLAWIERGDAPKGTHESAISDMVSSRRLDMEAANYRLDQKKLLDCSDTHFLRLLQRIRGLTAFSSDKDLTQAWDIRQLIREADVFLMAAWDKASAPIFRELGPIGRLQQLESAAIRFELKCGNVQEAGRLATRMIAEDEFIVEEAFVSAADAFICLINSEKSSFSQNATLVVKHDVGRMLKTCRSYKLEVGKSLVVAIELQDIWQHDPTFDAVIENISRLYERRCRTYDYLGIVSGTTRGSFSTELVVKNQNEERHQSMLAQMAQCQTEVVNPVLPHALQLIVDSRAVLENEAYILLVTDGFSWDTDLYRQIKRQIERMNEERTTGIHLMIVGLDIDSESIQAECRNLATVSEKSFYMSVDIETAEEVFRMAGSTMMTDGDFLRSMRSVIMESF